MGRFKVNGGRTLCGSVRVSGSKNAALPIIFASLTTWGVSRFYNLPDIGDVRDALAIIKEFGAKVTVENCITYVDTRSLSYTVPGRERVRRIRASTYLIGACLARFERAEILEFGGCAFSRRPIDMHIDAAIRFGAREDGDTLRCDKLKCADITFRQKSVGATVNALIMAASTEGESILRGCAVEPHISALISYLRGAGARISTKDDVITVVGTRLHGTVATIPGDMIEAGTFLAAGIITDGRVRVSGFDGRELASFTAPLLSAGVVEDVSDGGIMLVGKPRREVSVITGAYPAFPTDLQPIFAPLLALAFGGSIEETVWTGRFGYLGELAKMGLSYSLDHNRARIYRSEIYGAEVKATDLRGGAAAVLVALAAGGVSTVDNGELILRGYASFEEKLRALGADISYKEKY